MSGYDPSLPEHLQHLQKTDSELKCSEMSQRDLCDALVNFMGAIDTPVGRRKYEKDTFLMECVKFARDAGFGR